MQDLSEQLRGITEGVGGIVPELIITAGILVLLVVGLFKTRSNALFASIALVTSACSLYILAQDFSPSSAFFSGMLRREGFGHFLMMLVDVSVALTCLMSLTAPGPEKRSEYYSLLLTVSLGSHFLLMTTHLVMVFLSLEVISISSYVLAGYAFDKRGSESSLKYFLFGSVSSAIMLYGFTLLYGMSGTVDFGGQAFFTGLDRATSELVLIAGLMGLAGFLFKIAAIPMHPWAPDVYEGAPMPVIAFLSVAPKLAGVGVLAKFVLALHAWGQSEIHWQNIVIVITLLTITFGNLSAIWQKNPKRMMAYSSIAHSGFILVGVAVFTEEGLEMMLFYAAVYLVMNFAVFIFLGYFERQGVDSMPSFTGKGKRFAAAAVGLTVGLIALTGLPPTGGFTAKLFVFSGVWQAFQDTHNSLLVCLLVIGLLNTVISLFYYLRIPYYAFLKSGEAIGLQKSGYSETLFGFILVVVVLIIFFIPALLMGLINRINFVL